MMYRQIDCTRKMAAAGKKLTVFIQYILGNSGFGSGSMTPIKRMPNCIRVDFEA